MKFPWTHSVPQPEPQPETKSEPKPEPTFTVADLAERWSIDSLSAVKRITESYGFPSEWGETTDCWGEIKPYWKPSDARFAMYYWRGPDGHWLQSDIIEWEQSFYKADQKKREQTILKRELNARTKGDK